MAAPSGKELGLRKSLGLRAGEDFESWAGVRRQHDRGGIGRNALTAGENVRIRGGKIVSRGGQKKAMLAPLGGAVVGMFDDWEGAITIPVTPPGDALMFGLKADWDGASQPPYAQWAVGDTPVWDPHVITDATIWTSGNSYGLGGPDFAIQNSKAYCAMQPVQADNQYIVIGRLDDNTGPMVAEAVIDLGIGTIAFNSWLSYDPDTGVWYLAVSDNTAPRNGISTWSASTLAGTWTQFGGILIAGTGQGSRITTYAGSVAQFVNNSILNSAGFHYYAGVGAGDAGTDWTRIDSPLPGGGKGRSFSVYHFFEDKLHLVSLESGGGTYLWRYDGGTTLTLLATIDATTNRVAAFPRRKMWVYNSLLYIVTVDPLGGGNDVLHSWDGATLTTNIHDFGIQANNGVLLHVDGNLAYAKGNDDFFMSDSTDVTTWSSNVNPSGNYPTVVAYGMGYPFQRML